MPLATKLSEFADRMIVLLNENTEELEIPDDGIFYGDQTRIPTSPCICVEPSTKVPTLKAAGRMTDVVITLYILVYHSEIRELTANRRDADLLAEDICDLVNFDPNFFGLAIHCYVTDVTSGYSNKVNGTIRTTRITWEATTQERLPNAV